MSKKSSRHKNLLRPLSKPPLKSSWGAAVISFLLEFFFNSEQSGVHLNYDENLSAEGKRKKDLIWGPLFLLTALFIFSLLFDAPDSFRQKTPIMKIIVVFVVTAGSVGMALGGFFMIKNAVKTKPKNRKKKK